jgi:hypothetical protein
MDEEACYDVCDTCGMRIARRYKDRLVHEVHREEQAQRERKLAAAADKARREAASRPPLAEAHRQLESVVYYVRLGTHVKIGYSANLVGRLHALRAEPSDVLAIEPGGRTVEDARHQQFNHLRIRAKWENFTEAPDLVRHMDALREEHGIPDWLTPPRRHRRSRATPVVIRHVGDA